MRAETLRRYSMGRPYTFLTEMITVHCRWTLCQKFENKCETENKKLKENEVNSIASAFSPILVHWAKKPKHTMIRNGSGSGKQVEAENNALSQPHRPMKVQPVAHLRLVA